MSSSRQIFARFADKLLLDEVFNIAKDPKYNGYQRGLASMVFKFFDEKIFWKWC